LKRSGRIASPILLYTMIFVSPLIFLCLVSL
jgi:hypothetical protein